MDLEEVKPSTEEKVNVRMLDVDNSSIQFKLKKNIPLEKLMAIYCNKKGLAVGQVRFLVDGRQVKDDDTPASLKLKNGCVFDIYPIQTGGGFMNCK